MRLNPFLRKQRDPVYQLRMIDEDMEHWWDDNWQGKAEVLG
jgi:hypothetical protein